MVLTKELLAVKAFDMFRDWTKKAKLYYPELNFTIVDETLLVKDLIDSLIDAKNSLFKDEKLADRKIKGYDYGYIVGFVQGTLNVQWMNEYIRKELPEYKEFVVIKAIKNYLTVDKLTSNRISAIYKHLMEYDTNVNNLDISIPNFKINQADLDDLEPETDDEIITALDNKVNRYILNFLNEDSPKLLDSLRYYFSDEKVNCVIKQQLPLLS